MGSLIKDELMKSVVVRRSVRIRAQEAIKVETTSAALLAVSGDTEVKQDTTDEQDTGPKTPRKRKTASSKPSSAKRLKNASPCKTEYAPPEVFAHLAPLTDRRSSGLDILFCGINPGVESARVGYHFAHPSNQFWKCLFKSGLTNRLLLPSEESLLPTEFNIGLTDLVERPTAAAAQLSRTVDMAAGVPNLLTKVAQCRPAVVCFVGRGIADVFCSHAFSPPRKLAKETSKEGVWGFRPLKLVYARGEPHPSPFKETLFYVIPSTSGANAAYSISDKVKLLEGLRQKVDLIKSETVDTINMTVIPFPSAQVSATL